MTARLVRALATIAWLLAVDGCYNVMEHTPIEYHSAETAVANHVNGMPVEVCVSDDRLDKRLASKMGPYGFQAAPIYPSNDVASVVQHALETELVKRGFSVTPGGAVVAVEVVRFTSEVQPCVVGFAFVAETILGVNVKRSDGLGIFSRTFTGNGSETGLQTGGTAKAALEKALVDAIGHVINSDDFIKAVVSAASASPSPSN